MAQQEGISLMKKKFRTVLYIILALIVVAVLAVLSFLSKRVKPVPDGTIGNTAGNANNGGMFCEYNGTVYFSNPYDGGALYSMAPDESGMKKLVSSEVSNINAGGSYLFYYRKGTGSNAGLGYLRSVNGLYRSSLNGRNATCLAQDVIFNLQLIGNNLYYLSSDAGGPLFYQISTDKKDKVLLFAASRNFACALPDGSVYYNGTENNHFLYRYDTASGLSSVVFEGNLWYPVYDGGYFYYLDVSSDYRLCRYSPSEDLVEILTHDRVDCFNLAGGYIYYQKNSATDPALMRMTTDGKNVETVLEGNYTHISVTSMYVYFFSFGNDVPVYRTPVNGPVSVSTFDAARDAAFK